MDFNYVVAASFHNHSPQSRNKYNSRIRGVQIVGSFHNHSRRSGNYNSGIWGVRAPEVVLADTKFSSSTSSLLKSCTPFSPSDAGTRRVAELTEYVKSLLEDDNEAMTSVERLQVIDIVQRLGLGYRFEREIQKALEAIMNASSSSSDDGCSDNIGESLHACALRFRLLRQAGFMASQNTFNSFREERGGFKPEISSDLGGLLALYEASHLGLLGEDALEGAKGFAIKHLTEAADNGNIDHDPILGKQLHHALELPLHWRAHWAEAGWFIGLCCHQMKQKMPIIQPPLLELATLDYNKVQQVHKKELQELNRWWKYLGLVERVEFARDALVESFIWAVSTNPEPKMSRSRICAAKVAVIVHVIDDAYDVYGFLDELELFTAAIERWDINEVGRLPYYLQLCFLAVYNLGNELAYLNLKEQGFNSLPYIKRAWVDLCRSYMEEARSYHSRRDQTLDQYLKVAWQSVGCAIVLVHGYLSMPNETLNDQTMDFIFQHLDFTRLTSIIVRLINDLASSKGELERGDVVKSVECHMEEKGVSEEAAREHIEWLIGETWKMVNQQTINANGNAAANCPGSSSSSSNNNNNNNLHMDLPPNFVKMAVNVVRASHFVYKHAGRHSTGSSASEGDEGRLAMPLLPIHSPSI